MCGDHTIRKLSQYHPVAVMKDASLATNTTNSAMVRPPLLLLAVAFCCTCAIRHAPTPYGVRPRHLGRSPDTSTAGWQRVTPCRFLGDTWERRDPCRL